MKLGKWLRSREPAYILKRAAALVERYGITPSKASRRIESYVQTMAQHGCAPTFPTPGVVVNRYPEFLRRLQDAGAEIAVHGYEHVDLRAYPPQEASQQLVRAAQTFASHGIEVHGFRCPYLSCSDALLNTLEGDVFDYSSNKSVWWDMVSPEETADTSESFDFLQSLYNPLPACDAVCTPKTHPGLLEIPISLPDDLQLHDGLNKSPEAIAEVWSAVLLETHRRGELYVLQFHPELAWHNQQPYVTLLRKASSLHPKVWMARLCDIADWWHEKSSFEIDTSETGGRLNMSFSCSDRATILVRNLDSASSINAEPAWNGSYRQLRTRELVIPADPRPFVGLPDDAPSHLATFLREQGYILEQGKKSARCATRLDTATLAKLSSEVELVKYIETSPGPLVRYWRWPNGAKSALCLTGDLDALTLLDYAYRLLT